MSKLLFVSGNSNPRKVAGAIAHSLRDAPTVRVRAMGAESVNKSIKAIATARFYLEGDGYDLQAVPEMVTLQLNGGEKSAVEMELRRIER